MKKKNTDEEEITLHLGEKLKRLEKVGVTKKRVLKIIKKQEKAVEGYYGQKIAQGLLSKNLILRVVDEESDAEVMVATVYPGERRRYK
ncbi:MAG: hypothetical protein C5S38_01425 [Candidatus Methanophagaceae archaeon]|jgi:hypothetical protein|nr:MAG: hypothetical protein C5S38_01425 [Methanophagales archaeon]KAF5436475.1 hypothetical protein C5S36_00175 [Methanophagales archaeon]